MSLDKAIRHHKEHRRPYHGAKAIDATCRNHGSDDWAKADRLYGAKRSEAAAESAIRDYEKENITYEENILQPIQEDDGMPNDELPDRDRQTSQE